MSHEIHNRLVQRHRQLRDSDASRYANVSLVVHRVGSDQACWALIVTRVGGGRLDETRVGTGAFNVPPGIAGKELYVHILEIALAQLRLKP
jgi:hypothetical protein